MVGAERRQAVLDAVRSSSDTGPTFAQAQAPRLAIPFAHVNLAALPWRANTFRAEEPGIAAATYAGDWITAFRARAAMMDREQVQSPNPLRLGAVRLGLCMSCVRLCSHHLNVFIDVWRFYSLWSSPRRWAGRARVLHSLSHAGPSTRPCAPHFFIRHHWLR